MLPKLRTTKKQPEMENSVKTKSFNKKNVCVTIGIIKIKYQGSVQLNTMTSR